MTTRKRIRRVVAVDCTNCGGSGRDSRKHEDCKDCGGTGTVEKYINEEVSE